MEKKSKNVQRRYNLGTRREEIFIQIHHFGSVLMSFPDPKLATHVYDDLTKRNNAFYNKNVFGKGFYTENGVNLYSLAYN
jgi:hypothetical protein